MAAPLILSPDRLQRIADAASFRELAVLRREMLDQSVIARLTRVGELASFVVVVNLIHDRLIQRSVQLSVERLVRMGMGTPPTPYAFLLLGSGGRQEQAIISDQDNGLVYLLPPDLGRTEREEIHSYFRLLGADIVQGLEEAGYPPCQGNITCAHNRWRSSQAQWMDQFTRWAANPTWEHARYLLLAADARVLYGDSFVFAPVQDHYHKLMANHPSLLSRLVSNTLYHRVPLGWFGRSLTDVQGRYRGAFNLKNGVYLPLVNCVRHFSIAHGIRVTSTLHRLTELREKAVWPDSICRMLDHHFRQLLGLRLMAPLHWQDEAYTSNSYLKLSELSAESVAIAKTAMKLAIRLQKLTAQLPAESSR
jgi:CBS domain-containing protein